ncbi:MULTISPECIES: RAMP superfamily CRISPR-associated protein [Metallosphaera]|uniref:CRISPR-associated protein n=3 Tax=Metallosphaera TaxID=41980 RepID=A4YFX1_METS5|nr:MULTISPECIES: RAMP superfamily CRISPR-associated protein [Metallosphaera]ABP95323.1 CRISPR-associated protein [Metallosphaera sedula DSM 5348]AIM27309.1 CRISPR-associated protein [Metallosphaera sedula]AKV74193.1 hypothetical protein MsedA_1179 [Metallosphaera sedula]AKV76432.1 hypothetical protein MsedB_1181 [Metallosphaera sedula]AKV78684.1 hypothetical protein MsedC_1179 [Metallosphaera sedula]
MQGSRTLARTPRDEGTPTRVEITLEVVSDYLHVGQGKATIPTGIESTNLDFNKVLAMFNRGDPLAYSQIDNLFADYNAFPRDSGKVIIPGSTVKGAVRTRLEMSIPNSCYIVDRTGNGKSPGYVKIFNPDQNKRSDNYAKGHSVNPGKVCPVCDLLGSPGLGSRVSFSDLVLTSGRLGVAEIDKMEYEVAMKGSRFSGFFLVNLKKNEIGAILYGLGIRCEAGKPFSRTILLGRFKFENPQFGRVKFTANLKDQEQCNQINDFVKEYRPKDIREV